MSDDDETKVTCGPFAGNHDATHWKPFEAPEEP